MPTPYDAMQEAIRVVAASVGNPEESRPAAVVALDAAKALGDGSGDDWHGWQGLAMGLVNLNMALLSDRMDSTGAAPIDVLRSCAQRFPRR
jgi:hypothetical protein